MSNTVSTRLESDEKTKLDSIAQEEHLDRSTLIRKFVLEQIKLYEMNKWGQAYQKGTVSLQEASSLANVSLYEMMEYVQKENMRPPRQSKSEIEAEIDESLRLLN